MELFQTVIETREFIADVRKLLSETERWELITEIAADPTVGETMKGTGGAIKRRWARKGEGKRGGFRVVYYYHSEDIPVFLLGIFPKSTKLNLSKAERNELAKVLRTLADDYRNGIVKGAKTHVESRN